MPLHSDQPAIELVADESNTDAVLPTLMQDGGISSKRSNDVQLVLSSPVPSGMDLSSKIMLIYGEISLLAVALRGDNLMWILAMMIAYPIFLIYLGRALSRSLKRTTPAAEITANQDGLAFSIFWTLSLCSRLHRNWSDIHSITSYGLENWDISHWRQRSSIFDPSVTYRIVIDFKSGGQADIDLSLLTRPLVVELMHAIQRWGDPSSLSSDMVKLKQALLADVVADTSFTQLWITDLESRYSSTQFETLPSRYSLRGGGYTVSSLLAGSGLSAVYLAQDERGDKVVLKETNCPSTAEEGVKQKANELLAREARILCKLSHPQLARVIDHFVERERNYVVLEFVSGPTLRQIVTGNGPQSQSLVMAWASQLASILEYIHGQDPPVIHRDLSPDNIILRSDGQLVLLDFGASNVFVGAVTGTVIGKQSYMPPEQFRGKAEPASDIFALGATICFLLTGCEPEPLTQAHPREVNPNISIEFDGLVARCTELEIAERIESAEKLRLEIARLSSPGASHG